MLLNFADWLVYDVIGLSPQTHFGAAVNFFVYDALKIIMLLYIMIFVIGVLRTFLPQRKVKAWMTRKGAFGNMFASLFGALTPFCSCSSIPLFLSFLEAGVPLGVTFSFLIASPLINEYLVVLMIGFFGWKITVLYVVSGLCISIAAGMVLGRMRLERYLVADIISKQKSTDADAIYERFGNRLRFGLDEAVMIVGKVWLWVLVGVGVGAVIHNYVPAATIQAIIGRTGIFSVPIATILGVPMYGSCAAIVPIAVVLFQKGIPLGTALAFMMAIAALSLPEAIMLRRAIKLKLIMIFFSITAVAIIVTGYVFNALQKVIMS